LTEQNATDKLKTKTSPEDAASDASEPDFKKKLEEAENKYKYLYAEFDNFKKRVEKERLEVLKFGWEPVARELLQVVDNLERAISHASESADKTLLDGVEMTLKHFLSTLESHGVKGLDAEHQDFDPHIHEAVGHEASDKHEEGKVIKQHSKGYMLHGRLLRPAQVVVNKNDEPSNETEKQNS